MIVREMHQMSTNRRSKPNFLMVFRDLPDSTKSVIKRTTAGTLLLSYFIFLIYGGPVIIICTTALLQIKCFNEIIMIAYKNCDPNDLVRFKYISYHFLACNLLYFWGENVNEYFAPFINRNQVVQFIMGYNRFVCFCLYCIGIIAFVLNLKKKYYRKQFSLLAWIHIIILVVVGQSCLIVKTIFQGMIWFIICVTTITCNDIMAYVCGKLYGRTPLIALSPKKTWEGFIGAAIFTVIISCAITYCLAENPYFICPIVYREVDGVIVKVTQCEPDEIFKVQTFTFLGAQFGLYPIVFHAFWLAVFGSVIAPFGGFFASGFKRAFNIKDFGDVIPGHGGIMDRFDCQLVMITFVNVYISSFIGHAGADEHSETRQIFAKVLKMTFYEQLELFHMLRQNLNAKGVL